MKKLVFLIFFLISLVILLNTVNAACDTNITWSSNTTYTISQSNAYYCLNQSWYIEGMTAIQFASGIQNATLNCLNYNLDSNDTSSTYGINLTGSSTKNNTVKNCNVTDFSTGIYLSNGANNNTLANLSSSSNVYGLILITNANNNTISSSNFTSNTNMGIDIFSSSNNRILNSIIIANTNQNVYVNTANNNSVIGGFVGLSATGNDYGLASADVTNNFTSSNFTSSRRIGLDVTSWFNYNNDTNGNIWLKTNVSSTAVLTRKLIYWNQTLIQWNDTNSSGIGITANYNITGLKSSTTYNIYNNTILAYILQTDSSGNLPSFTIYLSSEHEVKVEKRDVTPPTYSSNSINSTIAGTPVEHRLKWYDDTDLSGYIFSFDNGTSIFQNDSWAVFSKENVLEDFASFIGGTINNSCYPSNSYCLNASNGWKGYTEDTYTGGNPGNLWTLEIDNSNGQPPPSVKLSTYPYTSGQGNVWAYKSFKIGPNTPFNLSFVVRCRWTYSTPSVIGIFLFKGNETPCTSSRQTGVCSDQNGNTSKNISQLTIDCGVSNSWGSWTSGNFINNVTENEAVTIGFQLWDAWTGQSLELEYDNVSITNSTGWSNVTKTVNSTKGSNIRWRVYANDTSGNWNVSEIYSFNTTLEIIISLNSSKTSSNGKIISRPTATIPIYGRAVYTNGAAYSNKQLNFTYDSIFIGSNTTDASGYYSFVFSIPYEGTYNLTVKAIDNEIAGENSTLMVVSTHPQTVKYNLNFNLGNNTIDNWFSKGSKYVCGYDDTEYSEGMLLSLIHSYESQNLEELDIEPLNSSGLVGYWKFEENSGNYTYDSSGNLNTGTLYNDTDVCSGGTCPNWVDGKFGKAIDFDGSGDHVIVPSSVSLNVTQFTVTALIYANSFLDFSAVASESNGGWTGTWYWILYAPSGNLRGVIENSSGTGALTPSVQISTGKWYFAAMVVNSSHIILYLNGSLIGSSALTFTPYPYNAPLLIGSYETPPDSTAWNGTIDEVRLYSRALTEQEIKDEYKSIFRLRQKVDNSQLLLAFTKGTCQNIEDRMYLVNSYSLPSRSFSSFSYSMPDGAPVLIQFRNDRLQINGSERFSTGNHKICVQKSGISSGSKPIIDVRKC